LQVHAHDGVAGLKQSEEDCQIGVGTTVGLDVGVLGAEELASSLTGDIFHNVNAIATAVVAFGGVALSVFIGEDAAGSQENGLGDDIFRGDELDVVLLTSKLGVASIEDFGVVVF
jgi:hypothetical protein